jgi:DNA primase
VGFCPFHAETRPSFYVNARKNLFYCHGCERGGDLICLVELSEHLSFRESLAYLQQQIAVAAESELLDQTAAFYRCSTAIEKSVECLHQRGFRDPALLGRAANLYGRR